MTKLIALAALAASILLAGDVRGTWTGPLNRPDGTKQLDVLLELKQDGDAVSGRVGANGDQPVPIQKAKFENETLTFEVPTENVNYTVTLKLDGDTLKGGVVAVRDGQTAPNLPLELKRSAR